MANIKIIDLPTGSPESTSFVEATQVDELAESGRATVKLALNALGNFVAGQGASPLEYGDLKTELTTLIGGINELHDSIGADAYDDTATYNTGDYCIHNGGLYKCNDDNVTGAWNAAKWDATILIDEISTGGGGASVTLGTTVPSDASGSNGDLYVQYDSLTYVVVEYFVKINGSWRKAPYSRVVALTQAEYDLITPDPTTLYIITDAQSSYQTKSDNSLDTDDKTVVGAINELHGSIGAITEYSTTERAVGKWIDGSTIYQKTLYIASMPDGSSSEVDYEFGNFKFDIVVDYSAILFTSSKDQFIPMPYIYTGSALADIQFGFAVRNNKSYIGIRSEGVDRSTQSGYVTIKYTKAT